MAETAPGIRQKGIDLTTLHGRIKLVHTLGGRKIGLKGFDFGAAVTKGSRSLLDLRFVRCDQKVVAFFAQRFANSNPIPVEAPVTIAKGRVADIPSLLWCHRFFLTPAFRCRSTNLRNRFSFRSLSRHRLRQGDFDESADLARQERHSMRHGA